MNSITGKHAFFMTLALRLAGDLTFGAKTPILAGLCYSGDFIRERLKPSRYQTAKSTGGDYILLPAF
jgi:hypothetical protein